MLSYKCEEVNSINVIIIVLFSIFLSYYIVKEYNIKIKSKYLNFNSKFKSNFFKSKFFIIKNRLNSLNNPYGLNLRNYIILKYFLSLFILILSIVRTKNIFLSILIFFFIYFLPNILIERFYKNENIKLINEIMKINNCLILSLSSNIPFVDSLKLSIDLVSYKRFKYELESFYNDYKLYNFNLNNAIVNIKDKFKSNEFNIFLNTLFQSEKEGNLIQSLEAFGEMLEVVYFKYLKFKETQRILFLTFSSLVIIVNLISIVMYPLMIEIIENFDVMFK